MKFLFFKRTELSQIVEEIYLVKNVNVIVNVLFNEETNEDAFEIIPKTPGCKPFEISFLNFLPELSHHFHVSITHYDEMEVGDFGEGFLFFCK